MADKHPDDGLADQLKTAHATAASSPAASAALAVALKAKIVRVRPSHNSKIVDVEWFYEAAGERHVVLVDGVGVAPDATDEAILTQIRARKARVLAEMGALIPDVEMNSAIVGQDVEL